MYKPSTLPSQKDKTGDKSILDLAEIYAKKRLQLLHRLDRPVSGLILLSKEKNFTQHFTSKQEAGKVKKTYFAICAKADIPKSGIWVDHIIKDGRQKKAYIGKDKDSKEVQLEYELVHELDNYVKYGARRSNKDRSIHLHAYSIDIPSGGAYEAISLTSLPDENDSLWKAVMEHIK